MTNLNTAAAQESGLKQAATAVAFALAPFAVVIGIATATEMMQPQSANAVGYTQSIGLQHLIGQQLLQIRSFPGKPTG